MIPALIIPPAPRRKARRPAPQPASPAVQCPTRGTRPAIAPPPVLDALAMDDTPRWRVTLKAVVTVSARNAVDAWELAEMVVGDDPSKHLSREAVDALPFTEEAPAEQG